MGTVQDVRDKGFTAGFAVACAILTKDHGQDDLAGFLINDAGITEKQMQEAGVDPTDIEVLKPLLKNT